MKRTLTIAAITAIEVAVITALVLLMVWVFPVPKHLHAPTKIEMPAHFHLEFMHGHSEFHKHREPL